MMWQMMWNGCADACVFVCMYVQSMVLKIHPASQGLRTCVLYGGLKLMCLLVKRFAIAITHTCCRTGLCSSMGSYRWVTKHAPFGARALSATHFYTTRSHRDTHLIHTVVNTTSSSSSSRQGCTLWKMGLLYAVVVAHKMMCIPVGLITLWQL